MMTPGFGASQNPERDPKKELQQPDPRGLSEVRTHAFAARYAPDDVVEFASSLPALARLEATLQDPLRAGGVQNVKELTSMLNSN